MSWKQRAKSSDWKARSEPVKELSSAPEAGLMAAGNTFNIAPKISAAMGTVQDYYNAGSLPKSMEDLSNRYSDNEGLAEQAFSQAKEEHPSATTAGNLANDTLVGMAAGKAIQSLAKTKYVQDIAKKVGEKAESVAEGLIERKEYDGPTKDIWLDEGTKMSVPAEAQPDPQSALSVLKDQMIDKGKGLMGKLPTYLKYKAIDSVFRGGGGH